MSEFTVIKEGPDAGLWSVQQTLLDPNDDKMWFIGADVDMRESESIDAPLLRVREINS